MRFFDREKEICNLHEIAGISQESAQFTVVTGRRRIGKTQLLLKATEGQPALYFFVSRKAEPFLCQDFQQEIEDKLRIPVLGHITDFGKLFQFLMQISFERSFHLIIDEFQEFLNINPSIYSEMQHYWDLNKEKSRMNLIVCGSVFSLMHRIFKDYKAPLFGRATTFMQVSPFKVAVLKEILEELHPGYQPEDLLALFTFTGGVAKYVQLLADNRAMKFNKMLDFIIREDSPFITDGKNMLIDEFGRDYTIYFTILSSIARGDNTRGRIEAGIGKEIGGYLTRLEQDYGLIGKSIPIFAKCETKNVRYVLNDNYLMFWFRFVYKYAYMIEIGQYNELKRVIMRDYATFSGKMLERYFHEKCIETGGITQIGGYWDKTGENEIDLITVNEIDKTAQIAEIKRNEIHIRYNALKEKTRNMMDKTHSLQGYQIEYKGFSMEDM
jgi:AAA+ ATPase superfamily predicted ATPase